MSYSPQQTFFQSLIISVATAISFPNIRISTLCFKDNRPSVSTEPYGVVESPRDIKNTRHLAVCLQSATQIDIDAPLRTLAIEVLEAFSQKKIKTSELWREVVPLAAIPDKEFVFLLISRTFDALTHHQMLDQSVLRSLSAMIRNLSSGLISTGNLVKVLQALKEQLKDVHQEGNTQELLALLQTTSQLLDAMAHIGVTGIRRTELQEPLDKILGEFSQNEDPAISFQARYARQALVHVHNDESSVQAVMRRLFGLAKGGLTLAGAIHRLDPAKLLETVENFSTAFAGTDEILKRLTELAKEAKDFISSAKEGGATIREALTTTWKHRWYAALQFMDVFIEAGQFVKLEKFSRESQYSHHTDFLLGLCQRLEQIARTQEDEKISQSAVTFLGDLVQNKTKWVQHKSVEQGVLNALGRLAMLPNGPLQTHAQKILSEVAPRLSSAQQTGADTYVPPVWDPIWRTPPTELLRDVRLNQAQKRDLQRQYVPLATLGQDIDALGGTYLKSLEEEGEAKDALSMYVALQCTTTVVGSPPFDLNDAVNTFLDSDKKVLLLLGGAGSGKSTFNRLLAQRLWQEYRETGEASDELRIPLYISLSTLKDPSLNLISEYFKQEGFTEAQIEALRTTRRFVFILDGYDEIAQRARAFYADNRLDRWQAQVIISSRPEYLGRGYQSKFQPPDKTRLFEEYWLAPFSDKSIENYIDRYVKHVKPKWGAKKYKQAFKDTTDLKELVRSPFMLRMALDVLPTLEMLHRNGESWLTTRVALYDKFVENWFARSKERLERIQLKPVEQEVFDHLDESGFVGHGMVFSQEFAVKMYQQEKTPFVATYSEASDAGKGNWREEFLGSAEKARLLRFNAPLIRQGGNQYKFIHASVQQYFVARALWENLKGPADTGQLGVSDNLNIMKDLRVLWEEPEHHIELEPLALFNTLNIVEDPGVLSFLIERVQQEQTLVKPLLDWMKASKALDGFEKAAANALTILVKAGGRLSGLDLSNIKVPGADLRYGVFDRTQFREANLSKVKLQGAWLRGANLERATLDGVDFGALPSLEVGSNVNSCCYSSDGYWLAVGMLGEIKLYQTKNLKLVHTLEGHRGWVTSVDFSTNRQFLASGSRDGTVKLWKMGNKEALRTLNGHCGGVLSVNFSPDSQFLVSGNEDTTVRLWSVESGEELQTLKEHSRWVNSVNFSPKGGVLASGSSDDTVKLWKIRKMRNEKAQLLNTSKLNGHCGGVLSVNFSPNGEILASGSADRTVKLWSVGREEELYTLQGHSSWVTSVNFSPNGEVLASGGNDQTVRLWSVESGEALHTFEGHRGWVTSVNFSPNGDFLASGSDDQTVKLWSVERREALHRFQGHRGWVTSLDFSPNGDFLASGSEDGTVRLWSVESGEELRTLKGHSGGGVWSVSFSPLNSKFLASGSEDGTVTLWNVKSGKKLHMFKGHRDGVTSVCFSSNGETLASGSWDGKVKLWRVRGGKKLHMLTGHNVKVEKVIFSPNDKFLASGGWDGKVKLWSVTGECIATFEGHSDEVRSLSFSQPSGEFLASASKDGAVGRWNVESEEELQMLEGHSDEVWSVSFSPLNSKFLASGSWDGTVKLWSVETGECTGTLSGFVGLIDSMVWQEPSERGIQMVAGGRGSAVHIWQVGPQENNREVSLYWTSSQNELTLADMSIERPQSLSAMNARLIEQRPRNSARRRLGEASSEER
ncbi:NACHT and WD40 repeat domain-containing protein [Mycoavidus cysteinexigens]|nr:pentapeptide repeat-containing protein [Mycoavidus cysteinexigens]